MNTQVETAIRATHRWVMTKFYGAEMPAILAAEFDAADAALAQIAETTKRERNRLARQGFGVELLKDLQFAIEDAGLWPAYANGAPSLTGRAYDLNEGLALAEAL